MKAVEELAPSAGSAVACSAIGVARATEYRHRLPKAAVAPKTAASIATGIKRGGTEAGVLDVLNYDAFADKAPAETYAQLLDQGTYLCSIRTMDRSLVSRRLKPASDRRMSSGRLHGAFRPTGFLAATPQKEACHGECIEDGDYRDDPFLKIGRTVLPRDRETAWRDKVPQQTPRQ